MMVIRSMRELNTAAFKGNSPEGFILVSCERYANKMTGDSRND